MVVAGAELEEHERRVRDGVIAGFASKLSRWHGELRLIAWERAVWLLDEDLKPGFVITHIVVERAAVDEVCYICACAGGSCVDAPQGAGSWWTYPNHCLVGTYQCLFMICMFFYIFMSSERLIMILSAVDTFPKYYSDHCTIV